MKSVSTRQLKQKLAGYLNGVKRGQAYVITCYGTPAAILTPIRGFLGRLHSEITEPRQDDQEGPYEPILAPQPPSPVIDVANLFALGLDEIFDEYQEGDRFEDYEEAAPDTPLPPLHHPGNLVNA